MKYKVGDIAILAIILLFILFALNPALGALVLMLIIFCT